MIPPDPDTVAIVLEQHRIDHDEDLACTCGMHFFPDQWPNPFQKLNWHEKHLAFELREALGVEQPWVKFFASDEP